MRCRLCPSSFDPAASRVEGDSMCCDACREVLERIRLRGLEESYKPRPPGTEERVAEYAKRVEDGRALFGETEETETETETHTE